MAKQSRKAKSVDVKKAAANDKETPVVKLPAKSASAVAKGATYHVLAGRPPKRAVIAVFGKSGYALSGIQEGKQPEYGGVPYRYRQFLTSFSNITMLKSCPSAIHLDQNARRDQANFSCLTSVGEGFKGGTFCLLQYGLKIPVTPDDMLICQSTREWHTNIGKVVGEKFSVVA